MNARTIYKRHHRNKNEAKKNKIWSLKKKNHFRNEQRKQKLKPFTVHKITANYGYSFCFAIMWSSKHN